MTIERLTPEASDMLEQRGIAPEKIRNLGQLVASAKGKGGREALAFRHRTPGDEPDHLAYRMIDDKRFMQSKGTRRSLWNNQCLDASPEMVIITEGHMDALSLMTVGFQDTMSVPDGSPGHEIEGPTTKYDYLKTVSFDKVKRVILAVDNDEPGQMLRKDLCRRIGRSRCQFVTWPRDCKDANDVLQKHGPEVLVDCITKAQFFAAEDLYSLDNIPESPPEAPMPCGIEGLDDIWKPSTGRMTVLTGIPGQGKSSLLTDVMCSMIHEHNIAVAVASFEDDVRGSLVPRIIQWYWKKPLEECSVVEELQAEEWIKKHFFFILPPEETMDGDERPADVEWFIEYAEIAALRHNCKMIILDPWNEIDHTSRPLDVKETEYIGVMLKRLRRACKRDDYHLIVAAHPTKLPKKQDGTYPMPGGYDIDGSANWWNKPDHGLTIHRGEGNRVTVKSWKCKRDGIIGTLGHRCFIMNKDQARYEYDELETFRPGD